MLICSFWRFAMTWRKADHRVPYHHKAFGTVIFFDKQFPKDSDDYQLIKNYVEKQYQPEMMDAFEHIWLAYKESMDYHMKESEVTNK